jgi:hypothetical protein
LRMNAHLDRCVNFTQSEVLYSNFGIVFNDLLRPLFHLAQFLDLWIME